MNCELCNWSEEDTGQLLDGVCERCNPESHASDRGEVIEL